MAGQGDRFFILVRIDGCRADMKQVTAGHTTDHLGGLFRIADLEIDDLTADVIHPGM